MEISGGAKSRKKLVAAWVLVVFTGLFFSTAYNFRWHIISGFQQLSQRFAQGREYDRVEHAREEKSGDIKKLFADAGLNYPPAGIFLRVFKAEGELELWAQAEADGKFKFLKTYNICKKSGAPGPKRKQGDGQVPEGFYRITSFNPSSLFWLSMQINYPNESDRILSRRLGFSDPGGDIFIHGSCVSIGCIPIKDQWIKELYLIALDSRTANPAAVHIFPARMDGVEMSRILASSPEALASGEDLRGFWSQLKIGYDYFEQNRLLPDMKVDKDGRYVLRSNPPE